MDSDQYCRDVEGYLCRRNAGHLVRLVGPAFERVVGWSQDGVPIRVVYAGIDRYFERQEAKAGVKGSTRRRPVRIEFCEADVLDAFDEWRRAVGVGTAGGGVPANGQELEGSPTSRSNQSLRAHLDRVSTRLTDRLVAGELPGALERHVEQLLQELAGERAAARTLRGEARQQLIARLQRLDEALVEAVRAATEPGVVAAARGEAAADLEGFRARMAAPAYARALQAALDARLRERWRLPLVSY